MILQVKNIIWMYENKIFKSNQAITHHLKLNYPCMSLHIMIVVDGRNTGSKSEPYGWLFMETRLCGVK